MVLLIIALVVAGVVGFIYVAARIECYFKDRKDPDRKVRRLHRQQLIEEKRRITAAWQRGELDARDAAIRLAQIHAELTDRPFN